MVLLKKQRKEHHQNNYHNCLFAFITFLLVRKESGERTSAPMASSNVSGAGMNVQKRIGEKSRITKSSQLLSPHLTS